MARTTFQGPVHSNNGFVGALTPPQATVATLPTASSTEGQILYVTDANSGAGTIAFSNGTNWIDVKTGIAVAA